MQLRLTDALAFGALISAVDPVATLAIFSAMDVEPVLNMLGTDIKSYKNFSLKSFSGRSKTTKTETAIEWTDKNPLKPLVDSQ